MLIHLWTTTAGRWKLNAHEKLDLLSWTLQSTLQVFLHNHFVWRCTREACKYVCSCERILKTTSSRRYHAHWLRRSATWRALVGRRKNDARRSWPTRWRRSSRNTRQRSRRPRRNSGSVESWWCDYLFDKKTVLPQGNRAMPQLFRSVFHWGVPRRQPHRRQA